MDVIEIVKFPSVVSSENLPFISYQLDRECNRFTLGKINWPETFPYKPDVYFRIAYNEQYLFLKFDVHEQEFRATNIHDLGPVWEDTCVEFFFQLPNEKGYYNIELNAIGTVLLAYGDDRHERIVPSSETTNTILRDATIKFNNEIKNEAFYQWSLTVKIPYTAFFRHTFLPRPGTILRGNFYKCGSKLPHPHYLSWQPVTTEKPDFHRPEYFGTLIFK